MAEIRCQKCGKLNPADLEVCQFCQARLKPAWSSQPSEADAAENEDDIPEWLRSLRGSEPAEPEETSEKPASSGLDWLGEVKGAESFEPEAVSNVFDLHPDERLDDWLSGAATPGEPEPPAPEEEVAEQAPEDFQALEEAPASQPGQEEGEESDWLARIRERQRFEQAEETGEPPSGEPEEMPFGESPEWLSRMPEAEPELTQSQPPEGTPPDRVEGAQPEESQAGEEGFEPTSQDQLPDWLKEEAQPPTEFEPSGEAEQSDSGSLFQPEPESAPQEDREGMPDWLTSLYPEQEQPAVPFPSPEESVTSEPEVAGEAELPAWLASGEAPPSDEILMAGTESTSDLVQSVAEQEPGSAEPQDAMPDWLTSLEKEDTGAEGTTPRVTPAFTNVDMSSLGMEEEIPDWLTRLESASSEAPASGEPPAFIFKGEKVSPFAADQPFEETPESGIEESLPDWIAKASAEEETPVPPSEPAEAPAPLAQAQLPNWLEAMRPVESAAPVIPFKDTTDSRVESSGPLSGLSGVLPVGPHGVRPRKPAVFTIKLQVSEELQNRAMMLTNLIEEESKTKPLAKSSLTPASYILRLVLFALLVVGVILAIWTGGGQVQLPAGGMIPKAVNDAFQQINALPNDAAVLLAVDYEPGFAGELDGPAQAVIDHLVRRGAVVVAVSSTPSGAAMAERLFQSTRVQPEAGQARTGRFQNLGYIPGGQSGLYGFAQSPASIAPYNLKGENIWNTFPLEAPKGLANFAMAVVITENAETARNWIEQVGPSLSPAPMLAVLSAQAEPMVQPYYAGNPQQIRGMVVGITGGASYEGLLNIRGLASKAWDSYSMLLTISAHVLLIGGLFSLIYGSIARSRQSKVEGRA